MSIDCHQVKIHIIVQVFILDRSKSRSCSCSPGCDDPANDVNQDSFHQQLSSARGLHQGDKVNTAATKTALLCC